MAPNTEILLNGATRTNARVTRHGPVFCNTHKDYGISNSCSGILSISTGREGDFTGMRVSRRRFFLFALFILFIIAVSPAFAPPALAAENPAGSTVTEGETASAGDAADAEAQEKDTAPLEEIQKKWRQELLGWQRWDVTLEHLGYAGGTFILLWIAALAARSILRRVVASRRLERRRESGRMMQRLLLVVLRKTRKACIFVVILFLSLQWLRATSTFVGKPFVTLILTFQATVYASDFIRRYINSARLRRGREDPSRVSSFGILSFAAQVAVWSLALLVALQNLGFEITALVAGLGIGGIAIAFALQNILGDIFCSVAIILDKPFAVGDFIIVGEQSGMVENIGIKTTRVRSLWGEQIVFSNADLTSSRIRNYKRMKERRVVFSIGVVYQTPLEKLERIPCLIRESIQANPRTRFDRAHFQKFGDFALVFEVVYYVLDSDYNVYMDIHQNINLTIFRRFEEEGVQFAYPTQELVIRPSAAFSTQSLQEGPKPHA